MGFRDVEGDLVAYLNAALTPPVSTRVPANRPQSFVRVWRTGGPTQGRVVDRAQVTVEAWGPSSTSALELAEQVRGLLLDAAKVSTLGFQRVAVESLYYDPDPVSNQDRYTLTVFLTVRANRA